MEPRVSVRRVTRDLQGAPARAPFYTTEKLSDKRSKTPEGYLLITDVPLARTGEYIYGPGETPVPVGADGIVRIMRDAKEVFRPETLASFNGKPVTNDHPEELVNALTWSDLSVGTVFNVRQGKGVDDDVMMGDMLITNQQAIDLVEAGKVAISCGYEADYEADDHRPGYGWQVDILGNHFALVDNGRCGLRCAIGDTAPNTTEGNSMATKKQKPTWLDGLLRRAYKAKDEAELENISNDPEVMEDSDDGDATHVHLHLGGNEGRTTNVADDDEDAPDGEELPSYFTAHVSANNARFAILEEKLNAIAALFAKDDDAGDDAGGTDDDVVLDDDAVAELPDDADKTKVTDSACLESNFQETLSLAEIIAPGLRFPVYDKTAKANATAHSICAIRRMALESGWASRDTQPIIASVTGKKDFDVRAMTCDSLRTAFRSVAAVKRMQNNAVSLHAAAPNAQAARTPRNISELNAALAAHWAAEA